MEREEGWGRMLVFGGTPPLLLRRNSVFQEKEGRISLGGMEGVEE